MKHFEKTLDTKSIFDGKIIHVRSDTVELENGQQASREVVDHPGGVCIAALLELPAGKLEKGQTPLENGKRELLEETGAIGREYIPLGKLYPSPGYCGEIIHLYFCKVEKYEQQHLDDDEFVTVERIPVERALEMVINNEIPDAKTQVAVLKTAFMLKKITDGDLK